MKTAALLALATTLAFGESKMETLSQRDKTLASAAAYAAAGDLPALKQELAKALDGGFSQNELKEALVQVYAYCGFPRSLNALATLMTLEQERGGKDPTGPAPSLPPPGAPVQFGEKTQTELCGAPVKGPLFEFAPAIDEYLKSHLFGDIFARGILNWREREIATVAMLAAREGLAPQLSAHIKVAEHNGVSAKQIEELLALVRDNTRGYAKTSPYPFGEPNTAYAQYFSGRSWLARVTKDPRLGVGIANVTFEPGCRNNWHKHTQGQILLCVGGVGFYQARGEKARRLVAGDVVEIPPNVEHWHGAAPDSWFAHLAMEGNPGQPNVNTWLEPVSDAEYAAATASPRP